MPDDKVTIELLTEAGRTLQAFKEVQKEIRLTVSELGKMQLAGQAVGTGVKEGTDAGGIAFGELRTAGADWARETAGHVAESIVGFSSVAGAATKIVDVLLESIAKQRELNNLRNEAATTEQSATTRFLIQTSGDKRFSREQRLKMADQAVDVGRRVRIGAVEALNIATEAGSQGVATENISEMMRIAGTWAQSQGKQLDRDTYMKPFLQMVRAADKNMGVGAAKGVAEPFFALWQSAQLQPAQLEHFAREMPSAMQAGLTPTEALAVDTSALDIYAGSAERASTFTRAFYGKLRSAKGDKQKTEALSRLGLNVGDVNFLEEDVQEVNKRLGEAFEKAAPEDRVPIATDLFGEEYGAKAVEFVSRRQRVSDLIDLAHKNGPEMEFASQEMYDTDEMKQQRAKARTERAEAAHGKAHFQTAKAVLEQILAEEGTDALRRTEASAAFTFSKFAIGGGKTPHDAAFVVKEAAAGALKGNHTPEQMEEIYKRIDDAMGTAPVGAVPDDVRHARAARRKQVYERGPQSELIGADPVAAAELLKRTKDQKKLEEEAKKAGSGYTTAKEKLAEFDEKQVESQRKKEAGEADEKKNEEAAEEFRKRQQNLADSEWREKHPGQRLPHHAPQIKLQKPKKEKSAVEALEQENLVKERAKLARELAEAERSAVDAGQAYTENAETIEQLKPKVNRVPEAVETAPSPESAPRPRRSIRTSP